MTESDIKCIKCQGKTKETYSFISGDKSSGLSTTYWTTCEQCGQNLVIKQIVEISPVGPPILIYPKI